MERVKEFEVSVRERMTGHQKQHIYDAIEWALPSHEIKWGYEITIQDAPYPDKLENLELICSNHTQGMGELFVQNAPSVKYYAIDNPSPQRARVITFKRKS